MSSWLTIYNEEGVNALGEAGREESKLTFMVVIAGGVVER